MQWREYDRGVRGTGLCPTLLPPSFVQASERMVQSHKGLLRGGGSGHPITGRGLEEMHISEGDYESLLL